MKNNTNLYFDIWRKKNFKSLIQAYIYTASTYHSKSEMVLGFGYALDKFVEGGRGSYEGLIKQWNSAYILGRELGVFYTENRNGGYELSPLAKEVLLGNLTTEEYLVTHFMNFSQLINGQVIHPLKEVLLCLGDNNGKITIEDIKVIKNFNLAIKSEKNQNQMANILLTRLVEAEILKKSDFQYTLDKYKFRELFENISIYEGTVFDFEKMTHKDFVDLMSTENSLLKNVTNSNLLTEQLTDGLFGLIDSE